MGVKTEEVAKVRLGPFLRAPHISLRRRACVNVYESRREIFVRRLVQTYFIFIVVIFYREVPGTFEKVPTGIADTAKFITTFRNVLVL